MSKRARLLLSLALSLAGLPALAEKADKNKPINIEADTVHMDEVNKVAVYDGHVILTQGTLTINAERIEIRQDDAGLSTGEARGNPVHFRQKVEGKDEYAEGWAKRMEYDGRGDKLRLMGEAHLKRGEEELRGNLITYDGKSESYQAQGGTSGAPGRVRAVIRPKTPPAAKP